MLLSTLAGIIEQADSRIIRSLSSYINDYVNEELGRGTIITDETYQDAIESWASQNK